MPAAAVAAVAVGASVYSANKNSKAAGKAADAQAQAAGQASDAQAQASREAIAEQRRQFDKMVSLLSPYAKAGTGALGQQQAILGLNGAGAQKKAISAIEQSPYFQATAKQGENAILQNASATGGLRGGNVQGALGQFRPQLLNQLVQQQYANLGGITNMGQSAAAGQAAGGMQSANSIGTILGNQGNAQAAALNAAGQAQAGGILGQQNAQNQLIGNLLNIGGAAYGAGAF
jgi:hypothetical protein